MEGRGQEMGNVGGWRREGRDEARPVARPVTGRGMRVGVAVGDSANARTRWGRPGPGEPSTTAPRCLPFRSPEALSRPALSGGRYFGIRSECGDYF